MEHTLAHTGGFIFCLLVHVVLIVVFAYATAPTVWEPDPGPQNLSTHPDAKLEP